jgi:hypothetical protein
MGTFLFIIFIVGTIAWFNWVISTHRNSREARERERYRRRMECQRVLPALSRYVGPELTSAVLDGGLDDLLDLALPVDEFVSRVLERFDRSSGLRLGNWAEGEIRLPVYLPQSDRIRHMYIVGKSGSGKTTLIRNLILQDLEAGHGLAVLAPEQELLTSQLLPFIPKHRRGDVIYINPADSDRPVPFNPLHLASGENLDLKVDENLTIFRRLFSQDGGAATPRMEAILREVLHTLIAIPGTTLLDVERLLDRADASFRKWAVDQVRDEESRRFWSVTYPAYPRDAHLPIMNRLKPFLRPAVVRNLLCTSGACLDVRAAMDERKVLLFNLSDGLLGEASALLLGQLVVAKLQLATMSRADVDPSQRPFFSLYIDEFQTFCGVAAVSYEKILSRARKYGVGLVLAHQQTGQLSPSLYREILGSVSTVVVFSVSAPDARRLGAELGDLGRQGPEGLQRLATGHAVVRLPHATLHLETDPPPTGGNVSVHDEIVERSRDRYGMPVAARHTTAGDAPGPRLDDLDPGTVL